MNPARTDYQRRLDEPPARVDALQFGFAPFDVGDDELKRLAVGGGRGQAGGLQHLGEFVILNRRGSVGADTVALLNEIQEVHFE